MKDARRFQLDEITIRPGTYFNPQTEVLIVVDDSPEVDHEIFEAGDFDATDWVLISDDAPVDEHKRDEQELEIRQMLRARSARMVGRGEPALDIDAEVSRLLAPTPTPVPGRDPGIEREVRQLVLARNERRARQGLERLDVDAEVTRTLDELTP